MPPSVDARTLTTKRDVALELARHPSAPVLATSILAALVLRWRRGGRPGRCDAVGIAAVASLQPLVEWFLHRAILHGPPRRVAGLVLDPGRPHRGHHLVPDDVAGALLGGRYAAADSVLVALVAAVVGKVAAGGAGVPGAIAAGEVGLAAYEWTHLLCHSGYRPRTRWMRGLRAGHLRHHFRDDATNFGITSRVVDRLAGTRG